MLARFKVAFAAVLAFFMFVGGDVDAAGRIKITLKGSPSGATAPILNDTSIPFGSWTQSGRGVVRLSSPTLGLLVSTGGSPVTGWNVVTQGTGSGCGNSAHWIAAGAVSEGASAITPTSSIAGDTAKLSSGTCNFTVTASNAVGTSPAKTLTLNVVANAVSLGDNAVNYPGGTFANPYSVAGFESGTTAGQRKFILTPGIQLPNYGIGFVDFAFTSEIKIVDADPARPAVVPGIAIAKSSGTSSYFTIENLTFDGDYIGGEGRIKFVSSSNVTARGNTIGRTPASYKANQYGFVIDGTTNNFLLENNYIRYSQRGFNINAGTNGTVVDNVVRYYMGQVIFLGSGVNGIYIGRNIGLSQYRFPDDTGDLHFDFGQRQDDFGGYHVPEPDGPIQPFDTGVTQNDVWENNIFFNADALGSSTGFASWRSGMASQSNGFIFRNNIIATSDANGWTTSSGGPIGYIVNNAIIKANTGDFTNCPPGACLFTTGPHMNFSGQNAANWTGSNVIVGGNFVGDDINLGPFATPVLGTNTAYNLATWTGFVNGDPRARLESKTFLDYQGMSAAAIATWVKDSFRRADDKGPIHTDGTWRTGNTVP